MNMNEYQHQNVLFSDDASAFTGVDSTYAIAKQALQHLSPQSCLSLCVECLRTAKTKLEESGDDWTAEGYQLEGANASALMMFAALRSNYLLLANLRSTVLSDMDTEH